MSATQGALNTAMATPKVDSNGNLGGVSAMLGTKYPYFLIKRASVIKPSLYNRYDGYKLYATDLLKNHAGLIRCVKPKIVFGCPREVETEIKSALEEGVIINV